VDGDAEELLGEGVLRQETDTNARYQRCRSARDTDTEEGGVERAGRRYRGRGNADTKREGMPMPRGVILNDQE
jgi:hypothetical protein